MCAPFGKARSLEDRKECARFILQTYKLFVMPCNLDNNHWALGVIDLTGETIKTYDSLGPGMSPKINPILGALVCFLHETAGLPFDQSQWKQSFPEVPKQGNAYDCGVFTLLYAAAVVRSFTSGKDDGWDFDQNLIPDARAWMTKKIYMETLANGSSAHTSLCARM